MRLGILLDGRTRSELAGDTAAAREAELDLVWLPARDRDGRARCAPLAAVALGDEARGLEVVAESAAGSHPIGLAEELAVADQALGGRLTGVLCGHDAALVAETLTVVRAALSARPFQHRGERWTLPADPAATVRVTPPPAQLELPLWLRGPALDQLAARCDAPLVDDGARPVHARPGRARPAVRPCPTLDGALDVGAAVQLLRSLRAERGIDVCALALGGELTGRRRAEAIRLLGARVRPQVQLGDELPPELVASWDEEPAGD